MTAAYLTSRSRLESYQKCPRLRFLEKDFEGRGLETTKLSLPLATGSAVHKGVEVLLKAYIAPPIKGPIIQIEEAVEAAIAEFKQAYETHEVDVTINESMQWIQDEHCALIELILRMWAEHPDGLPWLLKEYEVLEVEQWDVMPLVEGSRIFCPGCSGSKQEEGKQTAIECSHCASTGYLYEGGINLRSRVDALLRKRSDGSLYVWSLKTANAWDKRQENANRHDVQGISEMVCVEYRLHENEKCAILEGHDEQEISRIDGTQMTYLIKGRRELNEKLNVYQIKNGLLHPWAIDAGLLGEKEYAHSYWYKCELPHQKGTTKGGKPIMCEGNANHRLSDSWQQVNIWEQMTIKEWVVKLLAGEVQPSLPLPTVVINPVPYFRNDVEIRDWVEQVIEQEKRVVEGLSLGCFGTEGTDRSNLNRYFPQHRRSCSYPYPCAFQDVCWGPSAISDDPVGSGLYRLRTPVEVDNGHLETN